MALNEIDGVIVSAEKYDEAGLLRRIGRMMKGLSCPRASREYKDALIELERLSAPLTAILLPAITVIVLIVVSAVSGNKQQMKPIEIAAAEIEKDDLVEVEQPPEPVEPQEPEPAPLVITDVPNVGKPSEIAKDAVTKDTASPKVSTLESVQNVPSPVKFKGMFASPNTGRPGDYTSGKDTVYGTPQTEAAVLKALRWLKHTQNSDGSWNGPSRPAMTGFALLTYLAHGETPSRSREFGYTVEHAIEYLMGSVIYDGSGKATGFKGTDGNEYAFPIATYALSEAYGMTHNPNIKLAAEKCLARIIENQSSTGGWDYKFNKSSNRDDTSLGGWCIQAVKAGKMAGLHPDGLDECIKKAISCLKTRAYSEKVGFKYTADSQGGGGLAGVGCLAMQLLGYGSQPEVRNALNVMRDWLPSFDKIPGTNNSPQYYCYYAAQCKYQAGMGRSANRVDTELWKKWNLEMKKLYPPSIITLDEKIEDADGKLREMGYWQNKDGHVADKTMGTCLAALQLMVYYRYLPTTSLKATEVEVDIIEAAKDANDVGVDIGI